MNSRTNPIKTIAIKQMCQLCSLVNKTKIEEAISFDSEDEPVNDEVFKLGDTVADSQKDEIEFGMIVDIKSMENDNANA